MIMGYLVTAGIDRFIESGGVIKEDKEVPLLSFEKEAAVYGDTGFAVSLASFLSEQGMGVLRLSDPLDAENAPGGGFLFAVSRKRS